MTLYNFQEKMVRNWLNIGKIGVIKNPRGSGKGKIKLVDSESSY